MATIKKEKALDVVRQMVADGQVSQEVAEKYFPELKESEDKRIRNLLIRFVKYDMPDNYSDDFSKEDCLAWLEKQEGCEYIKKDWLEHIKQSWYKEGFIDGKYSGGTSKELTINDAATLKELIDFLENGTVKLQHDLTKYANWLKIQFTPIEKQGEQKKTPIEEEFPYDNPSDTLEGEIENIWGKLSSGGRFSATKEGFREVITHFVNYFKEQDDRELVEQKIAGWSKENNRWLKSIKDRVQPRQEWSEEDETVLNNLIYALANDRIGNDRDEYVSWLKSLKDRVQPQREWSEEDEKYCISVIEHLKNSITNGKPETYTSGRLTDWVRGMRERVQPQPKLKWKPTEEQIMCLQDAIDDYHRRGYKAETLKSLYEQLKQL